MRGGETLLFFGYFLFYVVKRSSKSKKTPIKSKFHRVFESLRPHQKYYLKTTEKVGFVVVFFLYLRGKIDFFHSFYIVFKSSK